MTMNVFYQMGESHLRHNSVKSVISILGSLRKKKNVEMKHKKT